MSHGVMASLSKPDLGIAKAKDRNPGRALWKYGKMPNTGLSDDSSPGGVCMEKTNRSRGSR